MDNILNSLDLNWFGGLVYFTLTAIAAYVYWESGRRSGIRDTLEVKIGRAHV